MHVSTVMTKNSEVHDYAFMRNRSLKTIHIYNIVYMTWHTGYIYYVLRLGLGFLWDILGIEQNFIFNC